MNWSHSRPGKESGKGVTVERDGADVSIVLASVGEAEAKRVFATINAALRGEVDVKLTINGLTLWVVE